MSGIPADLDLSFVCGAELIQVSLGTWQVQFHFTPAATLSVEDHWELVDAEGQIIDQSSDNLRENPFHLHLLLQRVVVAAEISAPLSFSLRFTGGLTLRVFVTGFGGESFSIEPGNIFV